MRQLFTLSLIGLIALATADPVPKPKLSGLTVLNEPYTVQTDGKLQGFAVDLMDKIAEKVGFEYDLKLQPDGRYGVKNADGKYIGMVGEVNASRADFALADITITDERSEAVDFTEPYINIQLAALIRKDEAEGLATMEDLVKKNELAAKSTPPGTTFDFGVIKGGSTMKKLSETTDTVGQTIHAAIQAKPDTSLVKNSKTGIEKAMAGRYAMIVESSFAEFITGRNCNITALPDTRNLYPQNYGIALPKGSPYLASFNKAIQELKADGSIDELKKKYWTKSC